ncbi:MAG: hypothetical protein OXC17_02455 [Aestuariivita sp.]|nr:hypothetical protein [Aestuariivita sp.]
MTSISNNRIMAAEDKDCKIRRSKISDKQQRRTDIVLSLRPSCVQLILAAAKTVELRRRFVTRLYYGEMNAFLYASSPTKALVGMVPILAIEEIALDDIWTKYAAAACVTPSEFNQYFEGKNTGVAIKMGGIRPLAKPMGLTELRDRFDFVPPQSFSYVKANLRDAVLKRLNLI